MSTDLLERLHSQKLVNDGNGIAFAYYKIPKELFEEIIQRETLWQNFRHLTQYVSKLCNGGSDLKL